ncbi:hypothetical protein V5G28_011020 [Scytonema sp. PRP1]
MVNLKFGQNRLLMELVPLYYLIVVTLKQIYLFPGQKSDIQQT